MNQIFAIQPYLWNGTWVFDDAGRGLHREALVAGMPEMMERATREAGIARPEHGFVALFSKDPFPGGTIALRLVRSDDYSGTTYAWEGMEGWLCTALFQYFEEALGQLMNEWRSLSPEVAGPAVHAWLRALAHEA